MSVEYEQANQNFRFFHELRMKAFQYALAIHGILLVAMVQYVSTSNGKLLVALFAIFITVLFLGYDIRTIQVSDAFLRQLKNLEGEMEHRVFTQVLETISSTGIAQKLYVRSAYYLLIFLWCVLWFIDD